MSQRPEDSTADPDRRPEGDADRGAGEQRKRALKPWHVVSSTLAAAFGVQSSRNRERDFTHGKAHHFIIAGIVFTVVFVLAVVLVVNLVLKSAG